MKIRHSCQHTHDYNVVGNRKRRERTAEWLAEQECPTCRRERESAEEKQLTTAVEKEFGLPPLIGTTAQVDWATRVRAPLVQALEKERLQIEKISPETDAANGVKLAALGAIDHAMGQTSAAWWLDNKAALDHAGSWVRQRSSNANPVPIGVTAEQAAMQRMEAAELKAKAEAEATLFPKTGDASLVAVIGPQEGLVTVDYPVPDEKLQNVVKGCGFRWNREHRRWVMTCKLHEDRAVEVANKLLLAGFPVQLQDPELRKRALIGEYAPERLISRVVKGKYAGSFGISWRGEDVFDETKKLRGSRWVNPHVVVPGSNFEEVLDFASRWKFRLSVDAQKLVEEQQQLRTQSVRVQVEAKKAVEQQMEAPEVQKVEVPDELKDNN